MKFRYSIVSRFALFFTGLLVFCILLTGYLVFRKASSVIVSYAQDRVMNASELAEQAFFALLSEVSNDMGILASSPTLKNYIHSPSVKTIADINELFRNTLENKKSYFQIRLIGVKNNGQEIIRFDKKNGEIFEPKTLQQKGNLVYFKETIKINKGELYFSKINLNEEYGVISNPPTPTLRTASPVFDIDGKIMGILIINVDLSSLFNTLEKISGTESQQLLVDGTGQYLYAPETKIRFGLQTKTGHNFFKDFTISKKKIFSSENYFGDIKNTIGNVYLSNVKQLKYFQGKRNIYLISLIEQNVLLQSAKAVRIYSLKTLFLVCIFSLIVSYLFTNIFSKKIKQVTKAIDNYDKGGSEDIGLPVNRKDEIGILANTFSRMKSKIDMNVSALNTALQKEQYAKNQREEFLQNMSHEMRTPLNTILGLTQLLKKQSPKELESPIINSLERSANNLAGLVYDVLDHQKLVEGKLQISYQSTNIKELLKDVHASYEYEAIQKGLIFNLEVDKEISAKSYMTDPLRLSQIVTNLVVNAIKYTKVGSISLQAKIVLHKTEALQIKVVDTGIGVHSDNLARINERFFREKEDLSGRYGSYGLGLSIVKQLTELFGGTLKALSRKNEGSTFEVLIPLIISKESKVDFKIASKTYFPQLKTVYSVLYIEDDSSTIDLMSYVLNDDCISLNHTNNVEKAIRVVENDPPDLIISDLMLEGGSILPILTEFIELKKIKCPLILVSALESEIMDPISTIHFQKPFDIDVFKDTVYRILGSNEYNAPVFSMIYKNYDKNQDKIGKVLLLLQEEFTTYLYRIKNAISSKDQKEWDAILHKLIAHIKIMKLTELGEILPNNINALKIEDQQAIINIFSYYLCCIRSEKYFNSTGQSF
ncbi:hypothetical protein JQC67_04510 [Aurantibacter crassamenti]|uniref:ATP-binding protein n=1 Tax=Aurantibacter crassamenti TaxID=1837375 RepID=UPI00193A7556|nr:ATP-binding protein [Aurantibacter crassamenti]MBM1105398.1 hypothetical protein [Aurantibacter crassamenti]